MTQTVNPEMVILAREYRDLTQDELATLVGIGQSKIAKLEGGLQVEVTQDFLDRLSAALKFDRRFFCQDWTRMGFGSSAFFYRKRSRITAPDRRRISSIVNLHLLCLKRYLMSIDMQAARELPCFDIEEFGRDGASIARAVRSAWRMPDGPVKNLTALIESAGVLIIPCDFGCDAMDATSLRLASFPPIIFISMSIPGDRWRFTLAHELAHLVMHSVPSETMEEEADDFAAELLMPEEEIKSAFRALPKIDPYRLLIMKQYWRVSAAALLVRADDTGMLSESQKRYLWMQWSKLNYRKAEPDPIPKETVQNYPNLMNYFTKDLRLSHDEIGDMALIPREVFLSLHASVLPVETPPRRLRLVQKTIGE